jgi:hypothetical protein
MLLRIEETVNLEFESIDIIPGESESYHYRHFLNGPTNESFAAEYMDVKLKTQKSAQTGLLHSWRLFANDKDTKICPVRMMILLARLYPKDVKLQGPLFLKVSNQGAILSEPMVSVLCIRFFDFSSAHIHK